MPTGIQVGGARQKTDEFVVRCGLILDHFQRAATGVPSTPVAWPARPGDNTNNFKYIYIYI